MPKLTDTQLVILSAAAQRDGGAVLPPPKRLKIYGSALTGVLKALVRRGLAEEHPAPPDAPAWRETKGGQRFMLTVSPAGLEAIGVEPKPQDAAASAVSKPKAKRKPARRNPATGKKPAAASKLPGNKQDRIIGLLRRPEGATIPDLQTATGWQPHSVRAALTGLRKNGHEIQRAKVGGGVTTYRIIEIQMEG